MGDLLLGQVGFLAQKCAAPGDVLVEVRWDEEGRREDDVEGVHAGEWLDWKAKSTIVNQHCGLMPCAVLVYSASDRHQQSVKITFGAKYVKISTPRYNTGFNTYSINEINIHFISILVDMTSGVITGALY